MNNPFHRAAIKAFIETLQEWCSTNAGEERLSSHLTALSIVFEHKLEQQAKAFDACKRGHDISMATLAYEESKALMKFFKRIKLDGNLLAAQREFEDHMKPHFEIRLW